MFKILIAALIIFLLIWANKIRIYLKWQKKAEAENFQVEAVGKNGRKICRMKAASDPDFYFVALGICQCPEFKATHKPCKHIYKIALNKGLIQAAPEGEA